MRRVGMGQRAPTSDVGAVSFAIRWKRWHRRRQWGGQDPQHECLPRESLLTLSEEIAALQLSFKRQAAAVIWRTGTPVREEGAGRSTDRDDRSLGFRWP